MIEGAETKDPREKRAKELSLLACKFIETHIKKETGLDVFAEVIDQQWQWSEFLVVFKQYMKVWQDITLVTMGIDSQGNPAGWVVESRKDTSTQQILSDADIKKKAWGLEEIEPDMVLEGIDRVPVDDKRIYAIAHFAAIDQSRHLDVVVNHTTGEIIGMLPGMRGTPKPIPLDDADAKSAEEQAWVKINDDLKKRVGLDAAQESRRLLKLTPLTAIRDESGSRIYLYRLWMSFSTCDVSIDDKTSEVIGWYVNAFMESAPEISIEEEAAIKIAKSELKASEGVQGPSVEFDEALKKQMVTVHWWHTEQGVNIQGDHTTVLLNASDGKIFSAGRKWRHIPPELLNAPGISAKEAVIAADRIMKRNPPLPPGSIMCKSVIQLAADKDNPSPVRDVLVWRVGYKDPESSHFTEVSIDCLNGESVRITGW